MRSRPSAMPPCGGVPYSSASRKKPNRSFASSSVMPSSLKIRALQRRVVDTDAAAADLAAVQHEVVGLARAPRPDRSRAGPTSSSSGEVNGWCIESQRCSSSFHSNSGKSTTQRNSNCVGIEQVLLLRDAAAAAAPSSFDVAVGWPGRHQQQIVGAARRRARAPRGAPPRSAPSRRALNGGLAGARPDQARRRRAASPDRRARRARCASSSSPPGTTKPRTTPPSPIDRR